MIIISLRTPEKSERDEGTQRKESARALEAPSPVGERCFHNFLYFLPPLGGVKDDMERKSKKTRKDQFVGEGRGEKRGRWL